MAKLEKYQPLIEEPDFDALANEIDKPNTKDFDFFVESYGTKIFRQYVEVSGLYKYKIYGHLDVQPEICSQVYMDLEYRRTWDTYVKELSEREIDGEKIIYWQVNFPWPMSNRDYTYVRRYKEMKTKKGEKAWIILASGRPCQAIKETSGVIRVTQYMSHSVMKRDSKGGSRAYMLYYDNPGGSLPTWLINWGAKTGVPQFLVTMQNACRGYLEYKASLKHQEKQQEINSLQQEQLEEGNVNLEENEDKKREAEETNDDEQNEDNKETTQET